jgi:[ribosomal protein S5]-alanine N-acetyltransferase
LIELFTDREILRIAREDDANAVVAYYDRNRAHFAPWEPVRPAAFYTPAFWRERLASDAKLAQEDRGYRLWISPRDDLSRVIGQVHFANVVRGAFHCCHLGFAIDARYEGRGVMRASLERAIAFAWRELRLHRIEANHRPENVRSAALLRRLGFVSQGFAPRYLHIAGAWRDHVLTALLNDDWTPEE